MYCTWTVSPRSLFELQISDHIPLDDDAGYGGDDWDDAGYGEDDWDDAGYGGDD